MDTVAIVVGAGSGRRMGGACKALLELAGKPLLCYSLDVFGNAPFVDGVAVAVPAARREYFESEFSRKWPHPKVFRWVAGGARRQDSVAAALEAVPAGVSWIMVHDAARPLITVDLLARIRGAGRASGAAVPGREPADTIKELNGSGRVARTLPRSRLRAVQTPQMFRAELLRRAYREAERNGVEATDDAALVERLGESVAVVEAGCDNIKITTPGDLETALLILRRLKGNRINAD